MLLPPRFFQNLKYIVPSLLLVWSLAYLTTSGSTYSNLLRGFRDERTLFFSDFINHEVDGHFDGSGIRSLCAGKTWTKDLVLTCEPTAGGLGDVKNALLHCIRISMELGSELVLPQIVTAANAKKVAPKRGSRLDYYFDLDHLNKTLKAHCPQMKVHDSLDELYMVPEIGVIHKLSAVAVGGKKTAGSVMADPEYFSQHLGEWLEREAPAKKRRYPFRIHLETPTYLFPVAFDEPAFAKNFGRIIRVRPDCRQLAATALYNLAKTYDVAIDFRRGIQAERFAAIEMPTLRAPGAPPNPYPPYADQAMPYLDFIVQNGVSVVYLAAGTAPADLAQFGQRVAELNATLVLKKDLLEGDDLRALDKLTEEQRALVDYEVMLRAGLVAGTAASSFAWNLALRRRHAYAGSALLEPPVDTETIAWQDAYSTIFGKAAVAEAFELAIWP